MKGSRRSCRSSAPYKVASREAKAESTVVRALDLEIGQGHFGVIAGPCSVESEEQIMQAACAVKEAGAKALRGGAFKPRTSPYSFQGLKEEGLKLLAAAGEMTGLAVVTEIMTPSHIDLVCQYADVLQIGARNMQNYPLLQAVGETRKPVLLKRGPAATIDEFLLAAEYILDQGNEKSCSASGESARSRRTPASRCRWPLCPTFTNGRICPSWSIRATERESPRWCRRCATRRWLPAVTDF